jgi:hypothetical protein
VTNALIDLSYDSIEPPCGTLLLLALEVPTSTPLRKKDTSLRKDAIFGRLKINPIFVPLNCQLEILGGQER